ncbi:phosphopantetheine-binding protein [Pseudonocardia acaciae]|uniref:phosphopantetheine-binding protein n=1 Tax=Pseudonocardia acaciae TaxID=551276 RepID=UPI00048DA7AB|nr:phosphopantetheine-binding protein [Pseudonocardia acaciae]
MGRPDELTIDGVRRAVAELLSERPEGLGDGDNLFARGLNSMAMMRLASVWQRHGVEVDLVAMSEEPTLSAWARLIDEAYPS